MQKLIVVLSHPKDTTAQRIVWELQERQASVLFLDTGAFPSQVHLAATFAEHCWQGGFWYEDRWYDLGEITGILVRRPSHYQVDGEAPELIQVFLENEATKGFGVSCGAWRPCCG